MKYLKARVYSNTRKSRLDKALVTFDQNRISLVRDLHFFMLGLCIAGLLVCSRTSMEAASQSGDSAFESANRLYEQGKFTEAASAYQKLVQSGYASTAVYFNLGNAFFKAGQIGQAVAAYRQAERISPRDPDLRANLQFARNQIQGPTLGIPAWQRWLGKLSLNEWTLLAAGAVWVWFLLLIAL